MLRIERLKLTNFKSFECVDVKLGNLNVLVGGNASGKSNFVQALKFLRDIANHNLENATSMQGGIEYLKNARLGRGAPVSVEVQIGFKKELTPPLRSYEGEPLSAMPYRATYHLQIDKGPTATSINILREELVVDCQYVRLNRSEGLELEAGAEVAKYRVHTFLKDGRIGYRYRKLNKGKTLEKQVVIPFHFAGPIAIFGASSLLEVPFLGFPYAPVQEFFSDLCIYEFDPKLPKKAVLISGKSDLEEDASNLAIVLKNILSDTAKKEDFIKLLRDVLPFVRDLTVDRFADQSMLAKIHEECAPDIGLPAFLISDGTINIAALIAALYFEKKPVKVFEEADRNIHPLLASRIVGMLKEVSSREQIIVTTHNPEVVRHVGIEDLLLISRDRKWCSTISRPADSDRVQEFLKDDIGVAELHIAGLLSDKL